MSGIIVVPDGDAPAEGRPVLSWAHGTTGIADECAPSKDPAAQRHRARRARSSSAAWCSSATDYEGLGTPGRHPYIVGESEGRGTLDIVRAAQQLERPHGRLGRGRAVGPLAGRPRRPVRQPDRRGVGARPRRRRHRGRRAAVAAPADRHRAARQPLPLLPRHGRPPGWNAAYPEADLSLVLSPLGDRAPRRGRRGLRGRPRRRLGTTAPTKTSSPPTPTTSNRGRPCSSRTTPASSSARRRC